MENLYRWTSSIYYNITNNQLGVNCYFIIIFFLGRLNCAYELLGHPTRGGVTAATVAALNIIFVHFIFFFQICPRVKQPE